MRLQGPGQRPTRGGAHLPLAGEFVEEAIEQAEREAKGYASDLSLRYLGLAQAFKLSQEPADGAEMFSLMRESDMPDGDYLTTFFNTGTERQRLAE